MFDFEKSEIDLYFFAINVEMSTPINIPRLFKTRSSGLKALPGIHS